MAFAGVDLLVEPANLNFECTHSVGLVRPKHRPTTLVYPHETFSSPFPHLTWPVAGLWHFFVASPHWWGHARANTHSHSPGSAYVLTGAVVHHFSGTREVVPGTQLEYVGAVGDTYQVKIDGLATNKRGGDSFRWRGVTAPGVYTVYNLRLATELFGGLTAAGTVDVMVLNPTPMALDATYFRPVRLITATSW